MQCFGDSYYESYSVMCTSQCICVCVATEDRGGEGRVCERHRRDAR